MISTLSKLESPFSPQAKFMNRTRIILPALAIIVAISAVVGQSPRGRTSSRPAAPKPKPTAADPTPQPTPVSSTESTSPTLAVVNDLTIRAAEIETQVRTAIEND